MFREFKCLAALHFYYTTLQQTAHLAYLMQKNDVLISDNKDALSDAVDKLRDIQKEETELPFTSACNEDGEMIIQSRSHQFASNTTLQRPEQVIRERKETSREITESASKRIQNNTRCCWKTKGEEDQGYSPPGNN